MPMLVLLLLIAALSGRSADTGDTALRDQILQADARQAAPASTQADALDAPGMAIYRLQTDRVLQVGRRHLPRADAKGTRAQTRSTGVARLWQRVDGHWQVQRAISVEHRVGKD